MDVYHYLTKHMLFHVRKEENFLRHIDVRDVLCNLSSLALPNVRKEPIVSEPSDDQAVIYAGLLVSGVTVYQMNAL